MSEGDVETDGLLVARIVIERKATEDALLDSVIAEDGNGDEVGLAEALGMLRLAEHTLIDARMRDLDDEDEDD